MAEERVIKIVVDKSNADKSVKDLGKEVKKTDDSTKELSSSLDKVSGGALSAFTALKTGLKSAVNGFKSLRVAIIATGIGALIVGILAVKEAFTSSEEGQNKFAKILGVIGSITGNLSDLLSNLGMKIIDVFENPKQAIKDFANLIKQNVFNRFNGILELIPNLSKAVKQLFKGDFSGASETAVNAVAKVALGTENLTDSIKNASNALKEFGKEVAEDAKKAAAIADKRAKADKLERNLLVERAIANRKIAELRLKSEERDKFSAGERVKFLKEASALEDEITNKEIQSAKLRFDAKVAENALANSTKADLEEEAQLKAKLINLETSKLNLTKRLETRIQALSIEEKAKAKAEADKKQKELDEEEKKRIEKANLEAKNEAERLQKISDIQKEFKKKREDEEAQTLTEKLELEKERKLLELEELKATKEQKADIIKFYDDKINNETLKKAKKTTEEQKQLEENVANAKKEIGMRSLSLLAELAGRGSKIGKGIAVTQATISGIEGVQNAYTTAQKSPITTLFPAYPLVQAGLAGAFSAVQIKKILSADSSGGAGATNVSQQGASAPSFNLVQGTGSNQIANSISQEQKPVQAYVVGSNVTTQQELDRRRLAGSSI